MFRVRLASGEEAVFRTVDELALGLQSGVLSEQASVFEAAAGQWIPFPDHPVFRSAQERAATIVTTVEPDDPPLLSAAAELAARGGAVTVYQMVSQSALELAARKRPAWILPTATGVVALVLLVGVSSTLIPDRAPTEIAERPGATLRAESAAKRTIPRLLEGDDAPAVYPFNLANRLSLRRTALSANFADSVRALSLGDLLAPSRLAEADSLRRLRVKLQRFESLYSWYLGLAGSLEAAYQDSARSLRADGTWNRVEQAEWEARYAPLEAPRDVARTTELLGAITALYDLLDAERFRIEPTAGRLRFLRREAGDRYETLHATVTRFAELRPEPGQRLPVGLGLLLTGIRHSPLPPRVP